MKIVENTKEVKPITFSDIKVGDVFKIHGDPKYYMKTETHTYDMYDCFTDDYFSISRNTVCISNGKIMCINRYTEVIPIDCELIIK